MKKSIVLLVILTFVSIASYAGTHTDLYPLMVDLSGWKAAAPVGSSMQGVMMTATRSYKKGKATLNLAIIKSQMNIGNMGQLENMNTDSGDSFSKVETIKGFKVTSSYDKKRKVGSFIVVLGKGAMITLSGQNVDYKEAKSFLNKLNWTKIKKVLK